jgi:hypothetical protein
VKHYELKHNLGRILLRVTSVTYHLQTLASCHTALIMYTSVHDLVCNLTPNFQLKIKFLAVFAG